LCFTDSDCIPQTGWLEGMVSEIRAGKARVVCGGVLPANPGSTTGLTLFLLEFRPFHYRMPARDVTSFVTCNVAITRELFDRYGPFDPIWPGEDTLLAERIRAGGERIIFRPEHQVAHINRSGWTAVLRHSKRLGWVTAQAMDLSPSMPTRHWLQRAWLLCALTPVVMPIRVVAELGIAAPSTVLRTLPIAPLMVFNYIAWNVGFLMYCWHRRNAP
jgi:GT2 family glycosyltransferase